MTRSRCVVVPDACPGLAILQAVPLTACLYLMHPIPGKCLESCPLHETRISL